MRIPTALLKCKVAACAAVILMTAGTVFHSSETRAWALLVAIFAAGLGIGAAVRVGTEAMKAYVHRWSLETFEHGLRLGREMEAAERLINSARDEG